MNIDFIGKWRIWFALSAIFIAVAVGAIFIKGLKFGIEFQGGTEIIWTFDQPKKISDVRKTLTTVNLGKSVIQASNKRDVLIRTRKLSQPEQIKVKKALTEQLGGELDSIQSVGAAWGKEITRTSLIALSISLLGLLGYISIRFEFKMAVSAITALAHDILITIGIYALVSREITPATIAALLTILGYSLYDTIVVFHRITENVRATTKKMYSEIVNASLNQVMVRSINTSITTLIPVGSILLFGGETLKDFAFALFIGIAAGTYSSFFIASPMIALWKDREPKYVSLKKRLARKEELETT